MHTYMYMCVGNCVVKWFIVLDCKLKRSQVRVSPVTSKGKKKKKKKKKLSPFGTPPTQEKEGGSREQGRKEGAGSRGGRREQERKEGGCYLHNTQQKRQQLHQHKEYGVH